jgi:lipopolysaccharide exporter
MTDGDGEVAAAATKTKPKVSLGIRAVRSAAWTILTGFGARGLGLVGTLWLTYYLTPDIQGAVTNAAIVANTAHQLSSFGVEVYIVGHPDEGRDVTWHATVFHMTLGLIAFAAVIVFSDRWGAIFNAPQMGKYVLGCTAAVLLERIGLMPERLLIRQLEFRTVSLARLTGELSYTVVSVGLAMLSFGGMAIVWANIARSGLRTLMYMRSVDFREWLTPARLSLAKYKKILSYSVPIAAGAVASYASRRWDNLTISTFFGEQVVGEYSLAYSLADVPATQVGEQIGDVLFPSFAKMEPEERKSALVRSTNLLSLIVFPLAVGLGAVGPVVAAALFRKEWAGVAPMLVVLSALSVVRPVGWTVQSYLQASKRPRASMILGICKVVFLLGCIAVSAVITKNPIWACVAVGVAFTLHSLASIAAVSILDKVSMRSILVGAALPLLATAPMALAILGTRALTGAHLRPGLELVLEVAVGGVAYIVAALVIARGTSRDFLQLVKKAVARRRGS